MNSEWTPQHVSYNENTLQYFDKHPCHSQKFVCKILQLFLKNAKFQGQAGRDSGHCNTVQEGSIVLFMGLEKSAVYISRKRHKDFSTSLTSDKR